MTEPVSDATLGDRELDVMGALWELGSGTVTEVKDELPAALAYTTVLTILRNLESKGFVMHEVEGRAHRYFPRVAQNAARGTALSRLIDKLFHGSPEQLLAQLVDDQHVSREDLKRLRRRIAGANQRPRRKP